MVKSSNYIIYFLTFVLFIFALALGVALFSLGDKLPTLSVPIWGKIGAEILFYIAILFLFYTERRVDFDIWLRSFLIFIFVRIVLSFGNATVFTFAPVAQDISFPDAFKLAFYGHSVIYLLQFMVTPFLAYPIVFGYFHAQAEKQLEEELSPLWEEEEEHIFRISPEDLGPQLIPLRIWRQFFSDEGLTDIKALIKGIRFSDAVKEQLSPKATVSDDIAELLRQISPTTPAVGAETDTGKTQETPPKKAVSDEISISDVDSVVAETSTTSAKPPVAAELSELDELLKTSDAIEQPAVESIQPSQITPETELEIGTATAVPLGVPVEETPIEISTESLDGISQSEVLEPDAGILPEAVGEIEPVPLDMPVDDALTETTEEKVVPAMETPVHEGKPAPQSPVPKPADGYRINSPDDFFNIPLRELIKLNEGKQSAQVLERLIKRGANFELTIPMQLLIPQLKEGRAQLTVEYVYSEIPIELVNFMSSDQSGDLSELMLELPLQEIMTTTDPAIIFGDAGAQEESKWAQQSEEMNIDQVFDNLSIENSDTNEEIVVEENGGGVLDLTKDAEVPVEITEQTDEEEPERGGFPKTLLDFASENGVAPMLEQMDKINMIVLQPVGVAGTSITPIVEWAATKLISPLWTNTPCYILIDTDQISTGIIIDKGMRSFRDALLFVSTPRDLPEIKQLLESGVQAISSDADVEEFELEPHTPLPFSAEREIKDIEGYFGAWGKLPGKSFAFLSAVSDDEDHWADVAAAGNALAQMLAGAGKMFITWQRAFIHVEGWTLAILPIKGGEIIIEFQQDIKLQEASSEVGRLMEMIFQV